MRDDDGHVTRDASVGPCARESVGEGQQRDRRVAAGSCSTRLQSVCIGTVTAHACTRVFHVTSSLAPTLACQPAQETLANTHTTTAVVIHPASWPPQSRFTPTPSAPSPIAFGCPCSKLALPTSSSRRTVERQACLHVTFFACTVPWTRTARDASGTCTPNFNTASAH